MSKPGPPACIGAPKIQADQLSHGVLQRLDCSRPSPPAGPQIIQRRQPQAMKPAKPKAASTRLLGSGMGLRRKASVAPLAFVPHRLPRKDAVSRSKDLPLSAHLTSVRGCLVVP
jgi:hypothetical protein